MELKQYFAPLFKWWWLILLSMIVAGGFSYLAVSRQTDMYQTGTTLMVGSNVTNKDNPGNNELFQAQQLASFYVSLAQEGSVKNAAMQALDLPPSAFPRYSVIQKPNTSLVEISVTDTSPERAMVVANTLAEQLINLSPTSSQQQSQERQQFIEDQLDELQTQMNDTQAQIVIKRAELGDLISARDIENTQGAIQALEQKFSSLQTRFIELLGTTSEGAINSIRVVNVARLPKSAIKQNIVFTVGTAVAVGAVLAIIGVYLLEYLDDTIKTSADIERFVGLPTLAAIARIKGEDARARLIVRSAPRSPVSEAFRALRTGIQFSTIDNEGRRILVTSSNPSEGKSTTIANLAIVLAQAGYSVLLMDADLRRPNTHKLFKLGNARGLTSLLLEMDTAGSEDELEMLFGNAIQPTSEMGLSVLTSGPIPPNPSELLGSVKMKNVLNELSERFDYLLIDSPPVGLVTDPVVLSSLVDGVLLVLESGRTRRAQFESVVARLRKVNATIIGVTLNRLTATSDEYYYYQSTYYLDSEAETIEDEKAAALNNRNRRAIRRRASVASSVGESN